MMNLTPLLNREGQLPGDGWYHLVPLGEFPHADSGRVQVIDQAAIDAMLNRFAEEAKHPNFGGLLIDQDHFSYDLDKSSESYGWVKELANRADGIWGRIEFSDLGETAVKNRRYKFVSPVFWPAKDIEKLDANKVRPRRIDSFGLTNNPNFKGMVPFSNRADADAPAIDQKPTPKHNMKQVAQRLGLSADASEDSILAALDKLSNRATGAETQVTALTGELTELKNRNSQLTDEQIAADLDAAEITDEAKRTKLTPVLKAMKNREERTSFLKDCVVAAPAAASPTFNRANAKPPGNDTKPAANTAEGFQQSFLANRAAGKEKSAALDLAIKENPQGYAAWRASDGKLAL